MLPFVFYHRIDILNVHVSALNINLCTLHINHFNYHLRLTQRNQMTQIRV